MNDSPAILGSQQQGSRFASARVAPNVEAHGQRLKMAAQQRPGAPPSSFSPFSANVRTAPYAPRRISSAQPQALQQLLEAFLIHHGTR